MRVVTAPTHCSTRNTPCASSQVHRTRWAPRVLVKALPEDLPPPQPSSQAPPPQPSTLKPDLMDPVQTVVWGGTLPSPRRAILSGIASTGIVLGGNLGGITGWLLSLDGGKLAGDLRLDTIIPVLNYKRCVDARYQFEFQYPGEWLADQTLVIRAAQRAEAERFRDYDIDTPAMRQQRRQPRQNVTEPVVAFGPANSVGEENVSVIVAPIFEGFSLGTLGTPEQAATKFLSLIAPEGSGKEAELIDAWQRMGSDGQQYYFMEYRIKGKNFFRHNISAYASRNDLLYTFNAQCPVEQWDRDEAILRKSAESFFLSKQS